MNMVRQPAVAGAFYPGDPDSLHQQVTTLLNDSIAPQEDIPKVMIVPHAGYIYSGPIAASAYHQLKPVKDRIRRVVLLGPSHRVYVHGLALAGADAFETPLGIVDVDQDAIRSLRTLTPVQELPVAHEWEHSLEVQLPFLQVLLDDFALIPLVVGEAAPEDIAEVLTQVWGNDETLILISSDLSHYLPYKIACETDQSTAKAILNADRPITLHEACGGILINGLLYLTKQKNMRTKLLDLRNSGDTAGDKQRVVGYGAFGFYETS